MNPVIFLDIDGVLNGHEWIHAKEGPRIQPGPARLLQILLERTGADVVITSTWRKWVHNKLMTLEGFARVLLASGIEAKVIDVLPPGPPPARARMIHDWLNAHLGTRYVVLDDLPMPGLEQVRTAPDRGLIPANVTRACKILCPPS